MDYKPHNKINSFSEELYIAAQNGQVDIVKELLQDETININATNHLGATALHIAAQNGHVNVVKEFLQNEKTNVNGVDNLGKTPLYIAIENGHKEVIQALLDNEKTDIYAKQYRQNRQTTLGTVNLNTTTDFRAIVLCIAAKNGHIDVVKEFLKDKKVNFLSKLGKMLLSIAIENEHIELIKEILNSVQTIKDQDCKELINLVKMQAQKNNNIKLKSEFIINSLKSKLLKKNIR